MTPEAQLRAQANQRGTAKFVLRLGMAIRGPVIRTLKHACWERDIKIRVEEDKGWLESWYRIEMTGPKAEVQFLVGTVKAQVRKWQEEDEG
jgi:hypothetical protein